MADASVTATFNAVQPFTADEHFVKYRGTLAVDAAPDTYVAAGLTVSLVNSVVKFNKPPIEFRVWSETLGTTTWEFRGKPGTTLANNKFAIYEGAAGPLAEISGAIPAGISGDTALKFEATFIKGN